MGSWGAPWGNNCGSDGCTCQTLQNWGNLGGGAARCPQPVGECHRARATAPVLLARQGIGRWKDVAVLENDCEQPTYRGEFIIKSKPVSGEKTNGKKRKKKGVWSHCKEGIVSGMLIFVERR